MMTTTYHPATNRYAAIVEAVRTPPPPRPRLHLARISLSVPPLAADDAPELAPAPRPSRPAPLTSREYDREDRAARRDALLADYAAAFPDADTRTAHAAPVKRLATRYEMSETYVHRLTGAYRKAHGLIAPRADAPHLARWQVDLLRYMADHGPVSAADLARHFGYASASNVSATISPLRRALVALTGDPDARHVIVTTHGCGYDLDRDAAGRYPVVVAALEGCVP